MMHASEETLAALRDGRTIAPRSYAHVDSCVACRRALGVPLPPPPDRSRQNVRRRMTAAVAVAALFATVMLAEPLRATAFGFVEIFEPHQIALVPLTQSDFAAMRSLPEFDKFGSASQLEVSQQYQLQDARAAERTAGFHIRTPSFAAAASQPRYEVQTPSLEQFAFSEAIAKRYAAATGQALPPMPAGMDGSTVRIALGSAVTLRYGDDDRYGYRMGGNRAAGYRAGRPLFRFRQSAFGNRAATNAIANPGATNGIPNLFLLQTPVPKIGSTGISIAEIERYFVDQPGVPARLAAAFAALRDPTTTLPIPVPIDQRYAQSVFVDGVTGLQVGDETGLGAVFMWERNGFVYVMGGQGKASEILALANTLR